MKMYVRRRWEETTLYLTEWGYSWFFLEVDVTTLLVIRLIQVFDAGITLKYDRAHPQDDLGKLPDLPLDDLSEFEGFEITQGDFEFVWTNSVAFNQE